MLPIIYTKSGCEWCAEVLRFLKDNKIPFEEREVMGNEKYFDELVQKSGQTLTPTIDLDGKILANTDVRAVAAFLKENNLLQ